ncbi:MAG TPA: TlpA disulfide reductase family protein [Stellaceae bacterium]|nr:TlpA disulfide reductase family protein [Stellaceae bacterium]
MRRLLVGAATATGVGLLIVLGLGYGPQLFSVLEAVGQPAPATGSAEAVPSNPVELPILDQPHTLPEIRFQDEQGHDLTLADFRGRVVLLNVWATWCVPCRKEMPTLDRLQARLGGKDFLVMALSIDRQGVAPVKRFYQEGGVEKLAIYIDPSGRGSHGLVIPGVPTTLLIDREGREVARKMGAAEWDTPKMVSLIERTMHGGSADNAGVDR